jgi:hypothetical protein
MIGAYFYQEQEEILFISKTENRRTKLNEKEGEYL